MSYPVQIIVLLYILTKEGKIEINQSTHTHTGVVSSRFQFPDSHMPHKQFHLRYFEEYCRSVGRSTFTYSSNVDEKFCFCMLVYYIACL